MKKSHKIILALILVGGFCARLYRVNYPLMDWHSFRQSDTASVTREFVKHHYPIWLPHYQDLGSVQSGLDNLAGYRMVEFPLINYLIAQVLQVFPSWDITITSRVAAALFSTLSIYLLFQLCQKWQKSPVLSLLAAAVFAFLPYSIFYGRSVLPEPFQVTFCLLTLLSFTFYLEKSQPRFWLATLFFFAIALLIKPTSIFIAPVLLVLAWQKYGWQCLKRFDLYLLALFSVLPVLWWRQFILQFPSGIPASTWLYNSNGIRLRPAWWRWLFYERLTKMWLGYLGVIFFLPGLLPEKFFSLRKKIAFTSFDYLTYAFLFGMFLYLVIFATGNVQHDYYQVILLPAVALVMARGYSWLWQLGRQQKIKPIFLSSIFVLLTLGAWFFAWRENSGKFNVNNWSEVKIAAVAAQTLPSDAQVIADGFAGDTNFLFQTDRTGWPDSDQLDEKIAQGASYYITGNFNDRFHDLAQQYTTVYQDENGAILDLTQPLVTATSSATLRENQL